MGPKFTVEYDKLVIAVGAYAQSKSSVFIYPDLFYLTVRLLAFNVPGVKANAQFLKDVTDARVIRTRILERLCRLSGNPSMI
jgi:NADH dehydrogenase